MKVGIDILNFSMSRVYSEKLILKLVAKMGDGESKESGRYKGLGNLIFYLGTL